VNKIYKQLSSCNPYFINLFLEIISQQTKDKPKKLNMHNLRDTKHGKKIDSAEIINIVEAAKIVGDKECVVVTGVTGQDGSHMVDYLLRNTDLLVIGCVRRLGVYNNCNISHIVSDNFRLVYFDLSDGNMISLLVEKLKPKYFINFAAQSFVGSSWDFALKTWDANSTAVLNILEAIRLYHPKCRFFQAGSSEEFGNVISAPQNEMHPLYPRNPYGASKVAARHLVKVWRDSYGLFAVQGWLYNHEGPRRGEEFVTRKIAKAVAKIYHAVRSSEAVNELLLGNIDARRDWSFVDDIIDGIWRMLNNSEPKDYVLASGEHHSIRDFVETAFDYVGMPGQWVGNGIDEVFICNTTATRLVAINPKFYRPLEVSILVGDPTRAKAELGWAPQVSFKGLVGIMVDSELEENNSHKK
jgi:GDPmannose 4,6-dehydratase